ncbi:hypothetical protein RchiOBHm_Chr2g0111011 [Rosa chinensis]|uniref:Uncharacterized protein n=1 Tax=Rosa chinensis TaxID=74649 RepID=A0A2P6RPU0_ROSCH|nr:hypothetical protein RchiOBHm_Chr2g0111011 [Rosa chinensis]
MLLVANSNPMVDFDSRLNSFLVNLDNRFDLSPLKRHRFPDATSNSSSSSLKSTALGHHQLLPSAIARSPPQHHQNLNYQDN